MIKRFQYNTSNVTSLIRLDAASVAQASLKPHIFWHYFCAVGSSILSTKWTKSDNHICLPKYIHFRAKLAMKSLVSHFYQSKKIKLRKISSCGSHLSTKYLCRIIFLFKLYKWVHYSAFLLSVLIILIKNLS